MGLIVKLAPYSRLLKFEANDHIAQITIPFSNQLDFHKVYKSHPKLQTRPNRMVVPKNGQTRLVSSGI